MKKIKKLLTIGLSFLFMLCMGVSLSACNNPTDDRTLLIQAYEEEYPQAGRASVLHYYGKYESGAIVAMLAGSEECFDCALWTETVAGYDFHYSDGNRIRVLYESEFHTLTQAYENGYLTKDNIRDISNKHKERKKSSET